MTNKTREADRRRPKRALRRERLARAALLAGTTLAGVALAQPAAAQITEWLGGDSDWFDPANWDNGVPVGAGTARISNTNPGGAGPVVDQIGAVSGDLSMRGVESRLTIESGGVLATGGNAFIGSQLGTDAAVLVTGAGSNWEVTGSLRVADSLDSVALVTVTDGAVLQVDGNTTMALVNGGTGTLHISNGGSANLQNTVAQGTEGGGLGRLVVEGNTSTLDTANLNIFSNGEIELRDGAVVTSTSSSIGLGSGAGAADVLVTGGASWTINGLTQFGYSRAATVTIEDGGSVNVTNNLFVGRQSNADGTVIIRDGGELIATSNVNIGFLAGTQGLVEVTGAGSVFDVTGMFQVGLSGSGTLTISDSGVVNAGAGNPLRLATAAAGTGTLNIGAAAGDAAAATGTLNAGSVEFSEGTATLVFNHSALAEDNYEFTADLESTGGGTHAINHHAGVTSYTGDGSAFTGTTTVSGGAFHVNNTTLGGAFDVAGGILGGTGTLGAVTVNGGTLAPGNSIGTLNVASAVFNPGSTYEVELNDAGFVAGVNNDLLNATGTVTINGGTIHVTPVNGTDDGSTYTPGTYTIITAGGGVSGTFDAVTDDFAFISFSAVYDANNVYLVQGLTAPDLCLAGYSANQCAAGAGVASLGAGSALYDAVLVLANGDAPGALDQLSGEVHSSGKTALINNSARLRGIINNRINSAFGGAPSTQSFPIMGYGPSVGLVDLPPTHRYGAWAQAYGAWGSTSATANTAAMRQDDRGFLIGADGHLGGAWHGGVFTGYGLTSFRADSRSSSGSSDNFHLGAYAGGELGAFNLNLGAAHTWHSVGTTRSVAFPGFTDTLTASYSARTMQLFGEASYRIDAGSARFEPFAGLAHVNLHTNGFTEAGGAAALTSAASSTSTTFSTIGVRAATGFHMGDMKATARGMIGWRHAFGNTAPGSSFAFASGNSFVVSGALIARNTAVLELGLDMEIGKNATFGLSYDGQFGSGTTSHSANARLAISF